MKSGTRLATDIHEIQPSRRFPHPLRRPAAAAVVAVVLGSLALGAGGCVRDQQVVKQAHDTHAQLAAAVVNDPEVDAYLRQIGLRIINAARQLDAEGLTTRGHKKQDNAWMFNADDFKFHLVNVDEVNAVSTGSHHMYIYNKFFQECQSEDELAAVMAHEYGHVYGRHIHQKMDYKSGTAAAVEVARGMIQSENPEAQKQVEETMGGLASGIGAVLGAGFTRADEDAADEVGFQFYVRAGWDPEKFADLFRNQLDKAGATGAAAKPGYLDDHPTLKQRVEKTMIRLAALPPEAAEWRQPPVSPLVRFRKIQEAAAVACANQPKNEAVAQAATMLSAFSSCFSRIDEPPPAAAAPATAPSPQAASEAAPAPPPGAATKPDAAKAATAAKTPATPKAPAAVPTPRKAAAKPAAATKPAAAAKSATGSKAVPPAKTPAAAKPRPATKPAPAAGKSNRP